MFICKLNCATHLKSSKIAKNDGTLLIKMMMEMERNVKIIIV